MLRIKSLNARVGLTLATVVRDRLKVGEHIPNTTIPVQEDSKAGMVSSTLITRSNKKWELLVLTRDKENIGKQSSLNESLRLSLSRTLMSPPEGGAYGGARRHGRKGSHGEVTERF